MAESSVHVDELLRTAGQVPWPEALALVQGLIRAGTDEPERARLEADGRIVAEAGPLPAVPALARLLQALLPPPGMPSDPRVPAALRYSLIRGLGGVNAPPFVSVEDFSRTLARFEQGDGEQLLQSLYARLPAKSRTSPSAPVAWDSWPIEGRAAPVGRGQAVRVEPERPRCVVIAAPAATRRASKRAGPALTALAVLSLLVAGGVAGAAVFVHSDGRQPSAILDAIRPQVTRVKEWVADLRAAVGKPADTDRSAAGSEAREAPAPPRDDSNPASGPARPGAQAGSAVPPVPQPEQSRPGSSTGEPPASPRSSELRGTTGADSARARDQASSTPLEGSPSPALDADINTSLPGQLVVALDLGRKPVFSPSFASDGTAVFYDEDSGVAGSALKEARTGTDNLLHVLSVLDDGARNYHPQLSPDGTTVAFDSDRDGFRGVYLSNRTGGNIRRVSGAGYAAVPSWSPDGRRLAFIKAEPDNPRVWNVWTLDVAAGATRQLTNHRAGQPWGASWMPDGRRVCYSHEDRLIILDTQTGASRVYPSPRKGTLVRTPAVSPDGRRVIFQLYRHGAWLLDLDDGSMRQVLDDPTAEEFAWSPDGSRVAFHSRRENRWGIRLISPNPNPSPSR